jgi:hypothetical protein
LYAMVYGTILMKVGDWLDGAATATPKIASFN